MRVPDDKKMAANHDSSTVDMLFGGHDHTYFIELNHQTEKWDADMRTEINTLKKVKSRYVNIEEEKYHYEELVEN